MLKREKSVLLVASHALMARALKRGLEEEGFNIITIASDEFAASADHRSSADAILVDVSPWEDFASLWRQLRRNEQTIPILALVVPNQVNDVDDRECKRSVSLLTKPFSFEQLVTCLNELTA